MDRHGIHARLGGIRCYQLHNCVNILVSTTREGYSPFSFFGGSSLLSDLGAGALPFPFPVTGWPRESPDGSTAAAALAVAAVKLPQCESGAGEDPREALRSASTPPPSEVGDVGGLAHGPGGPHGAVTTPVCGVGGLVSAST